MNDSELELVELLNELHQINPDTEYMNAKDFILMRTQLRQTGAILSIQEYSRTNVFASYVSCIYVAVYLIIFLVMKYNYNF